MLPLDGLPQGRLIHQLFFKGYEVNLMHGEVVMKWTPLGVKPRFLTLDMFISAVPKTKYKSSGVGGGGGECLAFSFIVFKALSTWDFHILGSKYIAITKLSDMLFKKLLSQLYGQSPAD